MIATFVAGRLPKDVAQALERLARAPGVARIAVMPDVHLADDVCVGTVVAARDLIYPAAVGGDIGCGVLVERFDVEASRIDRDAAGRILAALNRSIPRDRQRSAARRELDATGLSSAPLRHLADHDGRAQLGTLGSGNHFVELQRDDEDALWLMLHSGSRGMGPAIRAQHQPKAGLQPLVADSAAGQAYLADASWAVGYAERNRQALRDLVAGVLAGELAAQPVPGSQITCHHNHVVRELHDGEGLWVHRKGAIPASADEPGIIPGSMGSPSYHVRGRGHAGGLRSSSHGAGRTMSRSEARQKISIRDVERQLAGVWFDHARVDTLRDEAPGAYKDIGQVMRAQHELTRIVRRLRPVLCFKCA